MKAVIRIDATETKGGVGSTVIRGRGSISSEDLSLLDEFGEMIQIRNSEGSTLLNGSPTTICFGEKTKPNLSATISFRGQVISEQNVKPLQKLSIQHTGSVIIIQDADNGNTLEVTRTEL